MTSNIDVPAGRVAQSRIVVSISEYDERDDLIGSGAPDPFVVAEVDRATDVLNRAMADVPAGRLGVAGWVEQLGERGELTLIELDRHDPELAMSAAVATTAALLREVDALARIQVSLATYRDRPESFRFTTAD